MFRFLLRILTVINKGFKNNVHFYGKQVSLFINNFMF